MADSQNGRDDVEWLAVQKLIRPQVPGGIKVKPAPMPSPKIDSSVFQAGGVTISDLVSKVKQVQEGLSQDEK